MRVCCERLLSGSIPPTELSESSWLTVGKEYLVLSLEQPVSSPGLYTVGLLLRCDSGDLAWFPLAGFSITDPRLPSTWVVEINDEGSLLLGPAKWGGEFWAQYHSESINGAEREALRMVLREEISLMEHQDT